MYDIASGVTSYSSNEGQGHYVIFSVGTNWVTQFAFEQYCRGLHIGFKRLKGRFEGNEEVSFIVNVTHYLRIIRGGWLRGQKYVLNLGPCNSDSKRLAMLVPIDPEGWEAGFGQVIGMFQSCVTGVEDRDYTYDPTTQTYYIVVKESKRRVRKLGLSVYPAYDIKRQSGAVVSKDYKQPVSA